MMSKDLEKFITNNRNEFDDKQPPVKLWDNIEAALLGKKKKQPAIFPIIKWGMTAAAVLLIASMFYFKFTGEEKKATAIANEKTELPGMPQVNEFSKMIVLKQEELKSLSIEQPELYRKFTSDIIQLDSSYKALKDQLSITPNKELLVEAMIQNLELQLSVLNQQLNIIKQIKQSKEYSHEKSSPTI